MVINGYHTCASVPQLREHRGKRNPCRNGNSGAGIPIHLAPLIRERPHHLDTGRKPHDGDAFHVWHCQVKWGCSPHWCGSLRPSTRVPPCAKMEPFLSYLKTYSAIMGTCKTLANSPRVASPDLPGSGLEFEERLKAGLGPYQLVDLCRWKFESCVFMFTMAAVASWWLMVVNEQLGIEGDCWRWIGDGMNVSDGKSPYY